MQSAIEKLFAKLSARYGSKFTANLVGPMAFIIEEWCEVLQGCTPEQIAHGLDAWTGDWPPNAVEFWKACTGYHEPRTNEDYLAMGEKIGVHPIPGESWAQFNGRVKREMLLRGPRRLTDTLNTPAIGHDNGTLLP